MLKKLGILLLLSAAITLAEAILLYFSRTIGSLPSICWLELGAFKRTGYYNAILAAPNGQHSTRQWQYLTALSDAPWLDGTSRSWQIEWRFVKGYERHALITTQEHSGPCCWSGNVAGTARQVVFALRRHQFPLDDRTRGQRSADNRPAL